MLSGFLDLFSGSSDKTINFEEYVLPIPQHTGRPLTYTDCFTWLNQKVVILLRKFDNPQIGVVKYIGSDDKGNLCAGIEFEYNVNGMNGKMHGQKLFKCRSGHGLLIPVEYVRLLSDYEDGRNIFPRSSPNSSPSTSHGGVTNGNNINTTATTIPLIEDYVPIELPELKIGSNVVWMGGSDPATGIVRWIGKVGRDGNVVKVWMEMDVFSQNEIDIGTKFGCSPGRGKLLPVDELILLENYLPQEVPSDEAFIPSSSSEVMNVPEMHSTNSTVPVPVPSINNVPTTSDHQKPESISGLRYPKIDDDLIDFSEGMSKEHLKVTAEGNTAADLEFLRVMNKSEPMDTDENNDDGATSSENNTLEIDSSVSATSEFDIFVATAPPQSLESFEVIEPLNDSTQPTQPQTNTDEETIDVNGNNNNDVPVVVTSNNNAVYQNGFVIPEKLLAKLVGETVEDYLPPFIIPPIDVSEFFRAEGLKGIQGKRNSCYIDAVLSSMFAFTDTFDPYFLFKSNSFSKVPDSPLTKTGKKVLAEQIVNPLRQNYYCSASGVNELRELMIPFSNKLDGGFMDIEEFMHLFFQNLFQLKEFIVYENGVKDYLHQVHLGDHNLPPVMTIKQCLEMSFTDYNLKLQNIPTPAFIVEIPRNHSGIIQSTIIVPSLTLNIDTLLKNNNSTVMNLVAVICSNDFHFVTFLKTGKGSLSHWVMFDSSPSDERPKVEIVSNMGECLESLEHQVLTNPTAVAENKHKLPPSVQRLLSDIYVCIYCPA